MRRVPVLPTLVVLLAAAAMAALGLWQLLDRRPAKLALVARIERNPALPPVAFPRAPDDRLLFRRSSLNCVALGTDRAGAGAAGFRLIERCRGGALVQLGTTRDPAGTIAWPGGEVAGYVSRAPDPRPLIVAAFDRTPVAPMLVAEPALAGLGPNPGPDPSAVPNNHLAYAVQWFCFAAVALTVYAVALRRRLRAR